MTKKEKKLYYNFGKKWDVEVKHVITLSDDDTENLFKYTDILFEKVEYEFVILKRITRKLRIFRRTIYFNTLYIGEVKWN